MAKFYVISDVHGFYDEMKAALDEARFDPNDENSWLILCGDACDRGSQPEEVMDYLMSLPRKVLIKGNHEDLIRDCMQRGYAEAHDYSNGTVNTILKLGGAEYGRSFAGCCIVAEEKLQPFLDSMVNYFETEHYIFVHSWIPLTNNYMVPLYYLSAGKLEFNPNWRDAYQYEWEDARWGNPFKLAKAGLLPDKTLVFGHFHTSWPRCVYEGKPQNGEGSDFSIYYGDGYIGIDACTAYSKKVNVLVIEDEFLK